MSLLKRKSDGFSLIELVITLAIMGIVAAIAIPQFTSKRLKATNVVENIMSDLRYTRSRAIVSGTNYCFHPTGASTYEIRKLKQAADGTWITDIVVKTVTLPTTITWTTQTDSGGHLQFNTRGMQVAYANLATAGELDTNISDVYGSSHRISVWPSGQAYEEY